MPFKGQQLRYVDENNELNPNAFARADGADDAVIDLAVVDATAEPLVIVTVKQNVQSYATAGGPPYWAY